MTYTMFVRCYVKTGKTVCAMIIAVADQVSKSSDNSWPQDLYSRFKPKTLSVWLEVRAGGMGVRLVQTERLNPRKLS